MGMIKKQGVDSTLFEVIAKGKGRVSTYSYNKESYQEHQVKESGNTDTGIKGEKVRRDCPGSRSSGYKIGYIYDSQNQYSCQRITESTLDYNQQERSWQSHCEIFWINSIK